MDSPRPTTFKQMDKRNCGSNIMFYFYFLGNQCESGLERAKYFNSHVVKYGPKSSGFEKTDVKNNGMIGEVAHCNLIKEQSQERDKGEGILL